MAELSLISSREPAGVPDHANPALLVVDQRRRCVEASGTACALLGLDREGIIGGRVDRLLSPTGRERLEIFWRAFRDGGGHAGPFELAQPNGGCDAIEITMTENLVPGRHLLLICSSGESQGAAEARAAQVTQLRGPVRGRGPSAREREVLALLATGATDPQIAVELGLSPATVQTHVRNAKSKLGAKTRAQAIAVSMRQGLINA